MGLGLNNNKKVGRRVQGGMGRCEVGREVEDREGLGSSSSSGEE